ncbi:MAG TPA: leucyl aminopeptidase [Gammaproteobacteria bacterium]|jgi:leucyl aminopeptidase|nr:leucyl aminopeptidase [Gammaproteobacteria bacterium]
MKFTVKAISVTEQQKNCVVVGVFEDHALSPSAKIINKAMRGDLNDILYLNNFQGKVGQLLPVYHPTSSAFPYILVVGCGKENDFKRMHFRQCILNTMKYLRSTNFHTVACFLSELDVEKLPLTWKVKQLAEAGYEGLYQFDLFKTKKAPVLALKECLIAIPESKSLRVCEEAANQGFTIANAVAFTKNLGNLPSNICTPDFLAEQAKELAKTHRQITVKVLDEKAMDKLGMGALLGVSQGSALEAKLICLEYKGSTKKQNPIALVGKGITFDTGGNSLKSPDNMVGMKYDMCGAATVLGTIKAAAELKLPLHIVGIIPAVENMPGGTAYKPEDILTSLSGQTIEVISTDAEGRLILADALTYCERYKPEVVIDIATLTGAVVIALGHQTTGLMSNNQMLADALLAAGQESNDRAWQLPLWEEYQEQIQSPFADISNSGGRTAGSITAGCFLSRFTAQFKWAHLDVAGTAAMMMGQQERKATGRPVPLLVQYLLNQVKS